MITGFYAGFLGLMLVVLIVGVVRLRRKHRVSLGDGGQDELEKAIRAHGNFVEVVPLALIIMFILENSGVDSLALYLYGSSLALARVLHAYSIYHSPKYLGLRVFSMGLSMAVIGLGSLGAIGMYVLQSQ